MSEQETKILAMRGASAHALSSQKDLLRALAAGVSAAALMSVGSALGQDQVDEIGEVAAAVQDGVQTFEPAFFSVFNPITALDMVRQVPGFVIDDGDNARGFAATAGNILVDGERPSSKEQPSQVLQRIPASNVERIELIRGGGSDADVRGRTTLVNVIRREGEDAGPASTFNASAIYFQGGRIGSNVQLTRSLRFAGADVNLNFFLPRNNNRTTTDELLTDANGNVIERRDEWFQQNYREPVIGVTAAWKPSPRDAVNLNVRASTWRFDGDEASHVTDDSGAPVRSDFSANQEKDTHFREIGGDWERQLGPRTSFKLLFLDQDVAWNWGQLFQTVSPDGSVFTQTVANPGGRGERIGRGTFTFRPNERHTLEFGLENAFNFRDSNLSLTANGVVIPIDVAKTRVEEDRWEASITDLWTVTPKLSFEAGFNFEASTITQTGDAQQERDFTYPKPRLIATYALDQNDQLRFSIVRDVAQLDFFEFASNVSLTENTQNRGNEDLEPEQTWQLRGEWERRFGERSVVTFAGFYDAIESTQDLIAIPVLNSSGVVVDYITAAGNLGDGVRMGASIEGSTALDFIGLSNAQLRFEGTIQNTEVEDPLTGETRSFSNEDEYFYELEFRQDLPRLKLAWGWDYQSRGARPAFRADELNVFNKGEGDLDVFVETTRWFGVTLGLGVDNVFDVVETNERTFYELSRNGAVTAYELRDRQFGQQYIVRVSGAF
jgi:hypothetical protein